MATPFLATKLYAPPLRAQLVSRPHLLDHLPRQLPVVITSRSDPLLAGGETYGAGGHLEPEPVGGDHFAMDFTLAYNPHCTYQNSADEIVGILADGGGGGVSPLQ